MQPLSGAVGENARNTACDVALVQVALMKIARPAGNTPYLTSYDGSCGPATIAAIRDFIRDQAPARPAGAATPAANAVIAPGGDAFTRLAAALPAEFRELRCLPAGKTAYLGEAATVRDARLRAAANLTFAPQFRTKVNAVINQVFADHGIVVGVCPQGDRRNFQAQYALVTNGRGVTNAGPGESNHNFGMGVDIGFQGLRWIRANGQIVTNETWWLHRLDGVSATESLVFWERMRAIGESASVGAFRGPQGDRPHLQNWADRRGLMGRSLAAHLTRSGRMTWSAAGGRYECNLGYGQVLVPVGTATEIWAGNATLTTQSIDRARAGARPAAARPVPGQRPQGAATAQDVAQMRAALRAQFELADANWIDWRAV